MNTGENIKNAGLVLLKTYESIYRMIEQCRNIASKAGYEKVSDKFLRWKTDGDPNGWLISSFIILFQKQTDEDLGHGWRNGPVFAAEINILDRDNPQRLPELRLSRFDYANLNDWDGISPADHWGFHQPVDESFARDFIREESDWYAISKPRSEKVASAYWDLVQVVTTKTPLTEVTSDNLNEKVFGAFDRLSEI